MELPLASIPYKTSDVRNSEIKKVPSLTASIPSKTSDDSNSQIKRPQPLMELTLAPIPPYITSNDLNSQIKKPQPLMQLPSPLPNVHNKKSVANEVSKGFSLLFRSRYS
jgi:hypothetical protein